MLFRSHNCTPRPSDENVCFHGTQPLLCFTCFQDQVQVPQARREPRGHVPVEALVTRALQLHLHHRYPRRAGGRPLSPPPRRAQVWASGPVRMLVALTCPVSSSSGFLAHGMRWDAVAVCVYKMYIYKNKNVFHISSVQLLSRVRLFATP